MQRAQILIEVIKKNETEKKTELTHTTLHPKKSALKQEADVGHLH